MAQYNTESVVATRGNLGLFAADLPIDRVVKDRYGNSTRKTTVPAGQLVLYNPDTRVSIDTDDVATAKSIGFAISIGPTPGAPGEYLRSIPLNEIDLCKFSIESTAVAPRSGCPHIEEVTFDCIECNKDYPLQIEIDDPRSRGLYPHNQYPQWFFTANANCSESCKDCDEPVANCLELAKSFVKQINNRRANPDDFGYDALHQTWTKESHYMPFYAAVLRGNTHSIKLPVTLNNGVYVVTKLNTVTIPGRESDELTLTDNVSSVSANHTSVEQIENILTQINEWLGEDGSVVSVRASGDRLTEIFLEFNTIYDNVVLATAATVDTKRVKQAPGTCGLLIYAEPIDYDCECDTPPNVRVPARFFRRILVRQVGYNSYKTGSFKKRTVQEGCVATGLGVQMQERELNHNELGGQGRDFRYDQRRVGRYAKPDAYSRSNLLTTQCEVRYCVYAMVFSQEGPRKHPHAEVLTAKTQSEILVPVGDTTTKTALQSVLTALHARGICSNAAPTCGTEVIVTLDLEANVATVAVGEDANVAVTYDAAGTGQTLIVTSANPAIATAVITGGNLVITGVAEGTTTIEVATSGGSNTDLVTVTVTAA